MYLRGLAAFENLNSGGCPAFTYFARVGTTKFASGRRETLGRSIPTQTLIHQPECHLNVDGHFNGLAIFKSWLESPLPNRFYCALREISSGRSLYLDVVRLSINAYHESYSDGSLVSSTPCM